MGLGYETLTADGNAVRKIGPLWFAPRFTTMIGPSSLDFEVRVWPWLTLRSLVMSIDGKVVYAERGGASQQKLPVDDWADQV